MEKAKKDGYNEGRGAVQGAAMAVPPKLTDRILVLVVLVGVGFAAGVYLLGYQFLYWSFFDLDKPYLPEGDASEQVLNSSPAP